LFFALHKKWIKMISKFSNLGLPPWCLRPQESIFCQAPVYVKFFIFKIYYKIYILWDFIRYRDLLENVWNNKLKRSTYLLVFLLSKLCKPRVQTLCHCSLYYQIYPPMANFTFPTSRKKWQCYYFLQCHSSLYPFILYRTVAL
jgi:hypothetical protein